MQTIQRPVILRLWVKTELRNVEKCGTTVTGTIAHIRKFPHYAFYPPLHSSFQQCFHSTFYLPHSTFRSSAFTNSPVILDTNTGIPWRRSTGVQRLITGQLRVIIQLYFTTKW